MQAGFPILSIVNVYSVREWYDPPTLAFLQSLFLNILCFN